MSKYVHKATLMKAIAHPVRLEILNSIAKGPMCVCNLAKKLGKQQPYISQQLIILRNAELVTTERQGKYVFYQLNKENMSIIRKTIQEICANKENSPIETG